MSPILPNGTRNMVAVRRKERVSQLNRIASIENSFPIEGRAMLTEEPIKGIRKAPSVVTRRAGLR
jgi:hypothetical protein